MYRLMVVDDESVIRQGLRNAVPFEELGFILVGEAANGLEGVQLCEELNPDLIIADIRMPVMDGLTMCRKVQELLPAAHFIILSGYSDFTYAKQAIDIHALGYLLKPISVAEFREVLGEVKQRMDQEYQQRQDLIAMRHHLHLALPSLRERYLCSLLVDGSEEDPKGEIADYYGLQLNAKQYVLSCVKIIGEEDAAKESGIEKRELMKFAVSNILEEEVSKEGCAYVFGFRGALAVLFLFPDQNTDVLSGVARRMSRAVLSVEHFLKVRLAVGIGTVCTELKELPQEASRAFFALEYSMINEEGQMILLTDIEPSIRKDAKPDERHIHALEYGLKMCDSQAATTALNALLEQYRALDLSPESAKTFLLKIFLVFLETGHDMGVELVMAGEQSEIFSLLDCLAFSEVQRQLKGICKRLLSLIGNSRVSETRRIADQTLAYFHEHFHEEGTSADQAAKAVHVSISYFNTVFKKETGKTFHQVLEKLRMDRALYLLTTTDWKLAQVGAAVGIPEPSYFSFAFKHYFGYSASSVRKRKRELI